MHGDLLRFLLYKAFHVQYKPEAFSLVSLRNTCGSSCLREALLSSGRVSVLQVLPSGAETK